MKKVYLSVLAMAFMGFTNVQAQLGPNLLGAKGTFSAPFVTPNNNATSCMRDGSKSYAPLGNIGNKLESLSGPGTGVPKSGYTYVYKNTGYKQKTPALQPEYTYTLIKNIGDANGYNCVKGDWRAQDHTGDGGWFMAVNGAPTNDPGYSRIFYRIEDIDVCPG
ncbi:MAG: hypothetical protein J5I50_12800, partial [Chitinophagaceae bacterium]|nr:hypothetical protein [Chitinophagaceae bacterium]